GGGGGGGGGAGATIERGGDCERRQVFLRPSCAATQFRHPSEQPRWCCRLWDGTSSENRYRRPLSACCSRCASSAVEWRHPASRAGKDRNDSGDTSGADSRGE